MTVLKKLVIVKFSRLTVLNKGGIEVVGLGCRAPAKYKPNLLLV